jgi:hypothetical protein
LVLPGSYSIEAFSEAKLTAAFSTPGVSAKPFSTVSAQVVQVIPVIGILALVVLSDAGFSVNLRLLRAQRLPLGYYI